jgi:hypothetical protein
MMPFGVDVLGTLSEKLKQLMDETKEKGDSFAALIQLYKEKKVSEKDFFPDILSYVATSSALNFLMVRVILELKSALEKGTTMKDVTGATTQSSNIQPGGFGINSFMSSVTTVGQVKPPESVAQNEGDLNLRDRTASPKLSKTCRYCGVSLPLEAKFCSDCGRNQDDTH